MQVAEESDRLRRPLFRRLRAVLRFRAPETALTLLGVSLAFTLLIGGLGEIIDMENPENTAPNLRWLHTVSSVVVFEGLVVLVMMFYYTGLTFYYRIRVGGRCLPDNRSARHARMERDIEAYDALIGTLMESHESYADTVRRVAPESASVGDWVESDIDRRFAGAFPRRKP